ncbi:hypothetical protein F5880DRAFT_1618969 [Lentinula raphanica]|nr:hypothetical protein F5880DRAFT_1618969 [Lentinula raphanica]
MSSNLHHLDDESAASVAVLETQEGQTSGWDLPPSPRGWGYADRTWSRWGSSSPPDQNLESHIVHSNALRNVRSDFNGAGLSFEGGHTRDTSLDNLETKIWASVQAYRSTGESRKGFTPYPTFTGPQILQRLEEVQARLTSRIHDHQTLTQQIREAADALSTLQARGQKAQSEINALQDTERELEYLKEIAYALLM